MNWGKSIVLVFIVFAGFIGAMIYQMCRQRIDLVRDDYYQSEIAYQQQINRLTNASQKKPLSMTYQPDTQQLAVALPATLRRGNFVSTVPRTVSRILMCAFRIPIWPGRWYRRLNWRGATGGYSSPGPTGSVIIIPNRI